MVSGLINLMVKVKEIGLVKEMGLVSEYLLQGVGKLIVGMADMLKWWVIEWEVVEVSASGVELSESPNSYSL